MIAAEFPPPRRGLGVAGVGISSFNLCNALVKKGHRVTVFTRGFCREPRFESINDINVCRIPYFPLYPFHIQLHGIFLNKAFRSIEPDFDLVHIQLPVSPVIDTSLPVVVTIHSVIKTRAIRHGRVSLTRRIAYEIYSVVTSRLEYEILQNADLIIAVSSRVVKEIADNYRFDPEMLRLIGNGVDTRFFVPKKSGKNSSYVFWSGRLIYAKGVLDLARCAKYVCERHPSVSFVLAGTGPLRDRLKKLISRLGLEKKVILVGQLDRERLLRYYQNSDLYVLPSHGGESFPNVVLEAMACGIPVVASDVGEVGKVVKDGRTGYLVPPKDPEAMGQRIIKLLGDESLRLRMGDASRRLIENHYSCDSIAGKILDCYRLVVRQRS